MTDALTDAAWSPTQHGVSLRLIAGRPCRVDRVGAYFGAVVGGKPGSGLVEARVTCSTRDAAQAWCEQIAMNGETP